MTLEEIASRLSITRERVRQIQSGALEKVWFRLGRNQDGTSASKVEMPRGSRVAA
jgi:DNA-directed RNA polymerase sigma subunit (sigma70/sigma32)